MPKTPPAKKYAKVEYAMKNTSDNTEKVVYYNLDFLI